MTDQTGTFPDARPYRTAAPRRFFSAIAEGLAAHRRYADLAAMSDLQLRRRGLARADLPRIAFFGR